MRFTVREILPYYRNLELPEGHWHWNRKHYRIEMLSGVWVKFSKREDRISPDPCDTQPMPIKTK